MSIRHARESKGGQFQKTTEKLPKPKGGWQRQSVTGTSPWHDGQGTKAGPDCSIHWPIASESTSARSSLSGSNSWLQRGHEYPSHDGPYAQ